MTNYLHRPPFIFMSDYEVESAIVRYYTEDVIVLYNDFGAWLTCTFCAGTIAEQTQEYDDLDDTFADLSYRYASHLRHQHIRPSDDHRRWLKRIRQAGPSEGPHFFETGDILDGEYLEPEWAPSGVDTMGEESWYAYCILHDVIHATWPSDLLAHLRDPEPFDWNDEATSWEWFDSVPF